MSTFGTAISPRQAERWLSDFLHRWLEEYLAWYERLNGIEPRTFALPFNIQTSSEFTQWRGDDLPHIVIVTPGLAEIPEREAEQVNAVWTMGITAIVAGRDRGDVRDNQMAYATAIWTMLEHNRSIDRQEVRGVTVVDIQFTDIPVEESASFGSATIACTVDIEGVISIGGYPPGTNPRPDPYLPDEDDPVALHPGKIITSVERIS